MSDATDRQLAELMIRQMEANLDFLQSQPDTEYADIAYCLGRIAFYSDKLYRDFQTIGGAAR